MHIFHRLVRVLMPVNWDLELALKNSWECGKTPKIQVIRHYLVLTSCNPWKDSGSETLMIFEVSSLINILRFFYGIDHFEMQWSETIGYHWYGKRACITIIGMCPCMASCYRTACISNDHSWSLMSKCQNVKNFIAKEKNYWNQILCPSPPPRSLPVHP